MKRILLAVAVVVAALFALNAYAAESAAKVKMVKPDWHYRWHEGHWWYWLPESKGWLVWTDSKWTPYEKPSNSPGVFAASQAKADTTGQHNSPAEGVSESAYSGRRHYESGYSAGSANDYSGYGWTWGPGTAFRDNPGRRF
jgi:hypothetical protein